MKSIVFTVVLCVFSLCLAESSMAQGRGRGDTANNWLSLLRMNSVQNEIELVDDQQQQIERLQEEMWQEMRDRMSELRGQDMEPSERRARYAELREAMEERQTEYKERIEGILLPMQVKRLKELQVQNNARRNGEGAVGVIQNEELLNELGITDEQREKLEKKAEEVRKKLEEKIKKLRSEAEAEILAVLSDGQRKQLRDMIGDTFEFGNRNRRFGRDQGRESRGERGERGGSR